MTHPVDPSVPARPARTPRVAALAQAAFGGAFLALLVAGLAAGSRDVRLAGTLALLAAYLCGSVVWIGDVRAGRAVPPREPLLLKTDLARVVAVVAWTGFAALFGWMASSFTERGALLGGVAGGVVSGALIGIGRLRRALHRRLAPPEPAPPAPPGAAGPVLVAAGLGAAAAVGTLFALGLV